MPTLSGLPKTGDILISEAYPGVIFEVTERVGNNYPFTLWVARDDGGTLQPLAAGHLRNDGRELALNVETPQYLEVRGWSLLDLPGTEEAWARSLSGRQLASRLMVLPQQVPEGRKALLREAAFRLNAA